MLRMMLMNLLVTDRIHGTGVFTHILHTFTYIYKHLPLKTTINVGKYTIITWILWVNGNEGPPFITRSCFGQHQGFVKSCFSDCGRVPSCFLPLPSFEDQES